jgi:hypothetical protein
MDVVALTTKATSITNAVRRARVEVFEVPTRSPIGPSTLLF